MITRTKNKRPQTNGIVQCFHKTILEEFYRVAFRKKIYRRDPCWRALDVRSQLERGAVATHA
jgi:hypothetical protein